MSQYNVPDKATGDVWTAAEHNMLKFAHNDTDSRVIALEASQATQTAQISTNAANITANDTDIAALQAEQATQNTAIAANNTVHVANALAIASNDTDIAALQAEQLTQNAAIAGNDTDIAALTAGQAAQDAAIAANNAAIVSNDADIAALQASQTAQDTAIAANTAAATANATQAGNNATAIAALAGNGKPLGAWNADSNTPDLNANAPGNDNDFYFVDTAGTTNVNGQATWNVGDVVYGSGGNWVRIPSGGSGGGLTAGSQVGTAAARASLTGQATGTVFFESDTGEGYVWDGSAWRPLSLFKGLVATEAALTALPSANLTDGETRINKADGRYWYWDSTATDGGLSPDDAGVGQWLKVDPYFNIFADWGMNSIQVMADRCDGEDVSLLTKTQTTNPAAVTIADADKISDTADRYVRIRVKRSTPASVTAYSLLRMATTGQASDFRFTSSEDFIETASVGVGTVPQLLKTVSSDRYIEHLVYFPQSAGVTSLQVHPARGSYTVGGTFGPISNAETGELTVLDLEVFASNPDTSAANAANITALQAAVSGNDTDIAALMARGEPLGLWDANSNTPDLTTAPTKDDDFYFVGTSGTTTINGQSTWNQGDIVIAVGGAWVRVAGSSAGAMPNVFTPAGDYNASTNNPDMSVAANRVDGTQFKTYLVSTTGTQDLGNGPEEFEAGGQITWFSATSYRYDVPFKNGAQVGTEAQRLATGTGDLDAGNSWFETDTGRTYVWTGSAWSPTGLGGIVSPNIGTATGTTVPAGSLLYIDGEGLYRNTTGAAAVFSPGSADFAVISQENRFKGSVASATQLTAIPYADLETGDTYVLQDSNKVYTWNPTPTTGGLSPDDVGANTGQWMENKSGLTDTTITELLAATPTTASDSQVSATTLRGVLRIHEGPGDNTAVGLMSGIGNTGIGTVAIGNSAGNSNTGDATITIGPSAGINNTGGNLTAVGESTASDNTGGNVTAIGSLALNNNTGANATAVGRNAGASNGGDRQAALGLNAGQNNTANDQLALGTNSGRGNSAANQISLGNNAGTDNAGNFQICVGNNAGGDNTGANQVCIGSSAGDTNTGGSQVCIGAQAGQNNTGNNQVAIGGQAGQAAGGANQVAIGVMAGAGAGLIRQVTIGTDAGRDATGQDHVTLGYQAGRNCSATNVIAIGEEAGLNNTTSNVFIVGNKELPRFAGVAAANAALPAAPGATAPGSLYLWIDTSDGNTIKARI